MATEDEYDVAAAIAGGPLYAWQSLAEKDEAYVLGKTYAAIHSILFDAEHERYIRVS